jgi:hypothetical protein
VVEKDPAALTGMPRNPWSLVAADGTTAYRAYRDPGHAPPSLVVLTGTQELRYHLRCLDDLYEMLKERGGWVPLGSSVEGTLPVSGSVEEWARSKVNPLGGWYGLTKGHRGRFALYIPPIMAVLNLAEVENEPDGGRMRAL